ncbi:MAG: hypothetical protein AAF490_14745 [Chloroflexota bacterium]
MNQTGQSDSKNLGLALLRITLGLIITITWYDNLVKGLYTADGLSGFLNWLFDPNGNASSLTFYKAILDVTIIPAAAIFGVFQLVGELLMGLGLLSGSFTRFFGFAAMAFFFNLFLSYFGGHEWIWTYVILFMSSLTVTFGYAGRTLGVDQKLVESRGEPPYPILW